MNIREPAAFGCKPVDVRHLQFSGVVTSNVAVAQIVGKARTTLGGCKAPVRCDSLRRNRFGGIRFGCVGLRFHARVADEEVVFVN
ncbi:hypothetical protein K239x_16160 [Planctomycetes bacterium K23_9]|uniref:Uncharacterized protein n=1 Tax=Stieleria marina TaxID=1930275 RepID=A0A517NRB7_9BACT|nr:hypothetical protein K239x_16160 [Planctomycetes bacterium K23_9]